jgi:2-polyprenyl-3-methyl-5-hydroxy-6-metoxy-1,4-benzoquinol methylase
MIDMNTRETYNRIAEDWVHDHAQDTWWIAGTDTFVSLLPDGARVLDVGCAGGVKAQYLTDKGLHVVGIDNSCHEYVGGGCVPRYF